MNFNFFKNKNKTKMSINKEAALKEVSQMEDRIKELRKIIEAPEVVDYKSILNSKIACEYLGVKHRLPYDGTPENIHEISSVAYYELTVIIAAVWKTKGVTLETKNIQQLKYWPWFKQASSGFGLSCYYYANDDTCTYSGVRLSSPDLETMKWIADTFIDLYNKLDNQ